MTTAFQKLAGVIGPIIVENAQLGEFVETLQTQLAAALERAITAEQRVKELEDKQ